MPISNQSGSQIELAPQPRLRHPLAVDNAQYLDDSGVRQTQALRVLIIGFVIVMVDGYDSMMISFLAPLLARNLVLSPTDLGKIFAVGYLGAIVGAIAVGSLADRIGRKPMLIASLALASVATMICADATSLALLTSLRFLAGLALGGALPALISLTAEHARPERRNGTITLMYIGYPVGAVVGGAVTSGLLRYGSSAIFLGAGVASLIALALALLLPESLRTDGHSTSAPRDRGRGTLLSSLREQFAERRLWPGLMLWVGLFSMLVVTYFLVSWTPTLLVKSGFSPGKAALGSVLLNLGGVVGALIMAPVINRFGPYIPAAVAVGCGAVVIALLGQDVRAVAPLMFALFVAGGCIIGGQLNFPAMTVALYPQHVRGAGTGWTMGVGRLGSIVGPMVGGALVAANFSVSSLFVIAAIPPVIAAGALVIAAGMQRTRQRLQ
jgi:MFS transporter, AAHS family, 4-hydroxybenzoate transporter